MTVDAESDDPNEYVKEALGAYRAIFQKRLAIYIPDRDRDKNALPDRVDGIAITPDYWIQQARKLLDGIGGGVTALPAALSMWKGQEENTVIVYCHMDDETFDNNKFKLRAFLHKFGRDANQDEVLVEFGSAAFFIKEYDDPKISRSVTPEL